MGNLSANRATPWRLSEATTILPLIRGHLNAVAAKRPLATSIETFPIGEDGLLGYELVPDRDTHTYLILGCNTQRAPVLRVTSYGTGRTGAATWAAANDQLPSRAQRATRYEAEPRDYVLPTWQAGAELAITRLRALFPESPCSSYALSEHLRGFEQAIGIAHSRLARWDPSIHFFGVPDEAELGFALTGADGEEGTLTLQPPDLWKLRWDAPPEAVRESWSVIVSSAVADEALGRLNSGDRRIRNRRVSDRD